MPARQKIKQSDRHVESVRAALKILDSFLESPGQTLKQLTEQTGLTRNRVLRLAGTLQAGGYLLRDSEKGVYSLAIKLMSLGRVYERQSNLAAVARPILKELAQTTGESASIYVLDGSARVVLAREEGTRDVRMAITEGQRMALRAGAGGKILLAFGPPEVREKILSKKRLRRLAPGTITDPSELAAELDRVKAQGYACSLGEQVADAGAVAAPIFGPENRFLGALSIVGPITRFTPDTLPRRIKLIVVSASALTRKLSGLPMQSEKEGKPDSLGKRPQLPLLRVSAG